MKWARETEGGEREVGEKDDERARGGTGETITSLERGQSHVGPDPAMNHRGCLVPFPPLDGQMTGFMLELKGFCSTQIEL